MEEVWIAIPELNGKYECSNKGRIRRVNKDPRCEKYKYLKLQTNKGGYKTVNPTLKYRKLVHRIVAQLFIPNPYNKPSVNHIDSNRQNNNVINLEWCTNKENSHHAQKNNRLGRMMYDIIDINTGVFYYSIMDLCQYIDAPYKRVCYKILKHGFYLNYISLGKTHKKLPRIF